MTGATLNTAKNVGRDRAHGHDVGLAVVADDGAARRVERHRRDGARRVRCQSRKLTCELDPLDRLGRRALPAVCPKCDQPFGLHIWQRPQQNAVDHAEDRRRRANAKRQRQHRHRGEGAAAGPARAAPP